ncbi:MAG: Sjogren's syndrome/scleroderma autoantigen 1 family protein [Halobacteriales archaeon]|nr:Sjogren's syndrome/scleroderma autoantigen 1 family protein [Halobacteriales archaeon]
MSEFDKEAERERLRKKYEAEREDREATQRMSELLLQGATMTNKHCEACGDPIFRYEGQEFCPTCQTTTDQDNGETAVTDPAASYAAEATAGESTSSGRADSADDESPSSQVEHAEPESPESPSTSTAVQDETDVSPAPASDNLPVRSPSDSSQDQIAASRAAVSRTLAQLATRAEETDDLSRQRRLLAAVREAAEALTAIDDADR